MRATKEQLQELIGAKVVAIDEFTGSFDNGFILHFQKEGAIFLTSLTAQDGEYGDNAFEFLNEEEMEKKTFIK